MSSRQHEQSPRAVPGATVKTTATVVHAESEAALPIPVVKATVVSFHEGRHPARRLQRKAWTAFGVIAVLLVLQQALVEPGLARLTSDAPVINVAGRQRMLSQRLVKGALALERSVTPAEVARWRAHVAEILAEWRSAHRGLRLGNVDMRLPPTAQPEIVAAFQSLEPHFEAMASAAEDLVTTVPSSPDLPSPGLRDAVERLLAHEGEFLSRMHAIVGLYESEARTHVAELQLTGWLLALGVIAVAFAAQMGILQPAIGMLGRRMEQSERQYRMLVESMSDGLVLLDARGRIRFANPRFHEMTGLQPDTTADSEQRTHSELFFTDCVAPTDRPAWLDILGEPEPTVKQTELLLRRTDGQTLPALVSARRFPRETGYHSALLLVISDISARKAGEARMRGLQEQLSHATRLKSMGEMAATLAHEINQPLGAIANFAEGCLAQLGTTSPADRPEADMRPALERILRAAIRGGEIIRRARRFVAPGAPEAALEDVNALLLDVEQLCQPEARLHGIRLDLDLDPNLRPVVVDGIQLQQVVTNLVQNSLHAIREYRDRGAVFDTGRVTLRTRALNNGGLRIEVEDDGPGISPDLAANIFEPFFTTRPEGTGMGLAIVRNIVEAHGGRVSFEPTRPHGTLFSVNLPTTATSAESPPPEQTEATAGALAQT